MEIDAPVNAAEADNADDEGNESSEQNKIIKIHPLAIIEISDHHTRVSLGGSPFPPDSPVLGLLFGTVTAIAGGASVVSVVDAQEVEFSHALPLGAVFGGGSEEERKSHQASVEVKIELHQAVFPQQQVVGWYRVVGHDDGPAAEDLSITRDSIQGCVDGSAVHGSTEGVVPLFLLMNSNAGDTATSTGDDDNNNSNNDALGEVELPLSVFETAHDNAVFVQLDFELDTFEPERIAVEKVFRSRPDAAPGEEATAPSTRVLRDVSSGVESLHARCRILEGFLRDTRDGVLPLDHRLLREVDGLVRRLPVLADRETLRRQSDTDHEDTLLLAYLATLAKTAAAVETYSHKVDALSGDGRETRRF